jgi:Tfp pilus assembly protein PilV
MTEPKKSRSKGKALTSVKTWDDSSSEDEPPRTRNHHSSSLSSCSSHKCLRVKGNTSIPSSSDSNSDDEDKLSLDEFVHAVKFFEEVCSKQKAQLKTLEK